jgi:hypothetical protein
MVKTFLTKRAKIKPHPEATSFKVTGFPSKLAVPKVTFEGEDVPYKEGKN